MLITDTVVRLIEGAIREKSAKIESFSHELQAGMVYLEYPQYTKPRIYKKLSVPKILLSGNHKKIANWQNEESAKQTLKYRPDLIKTAKKD